MPTKKTPSVPPAPYCKEPIRVRETDEPGTYTVEEQADLDVEASNSDDPQTAVAVNQRYQATGRRLQAAYNACQGIPTEELEADLIPAAINMLTALHTRVNTLLRLPEVAITLAMHRTATATFGRRLELDSEELGALLKRTNPGRDYPPARSFVRDQGAVDTTTVRRQEPLCLTINEVLSFFLQFVALDLTGSPAQKAHLFKDLGQLIAKYSGMNFQGK